jgi:5'-3' exonuclease
MHPSSILSYYPTYSILDEIVSYSDYDTLNLYLDLKNNLQSLYMQHAIINLVESTLMSNYINTAVFESLLSFLSFHRLYAVKRKININFYIFFETGRSSYHTNISKKYKISRKIDDLYGLEREKRELFAEIVQKNLQLIDKACNLMPGIKIIRVPNLEADFIPYYLLRNSLVSDSPNVAHVIYSNDHDLYQCVGDNAYVFCKTGKKKRIIKKNEVMNEYLKFKNNFPDKYFPLVMAIVGDPGDDVDGISGIGPKRAAGLLDELVSLAGGIEKLYDDVFNSRPIFQFGDSTFKNKYINQIVDQETKNSLISNNLRLVSFELLSRELDNPSTTEMIEKREFILSILRGNKQARLESMKKALEMNRVFVDKDILEVIYYNGGS